MTDSTSDTLFAEPVPPPPPPAQQAKRRWWKRLLLWLMGLALVVGLLGALAYISLDSGIGRRFIADRIEQLAPKSGLRIKIGRIEGSVYGRATLRDVRLSDPQGQFFTAPEVRLDWRPLLFATVNRLHINELIIPRAELARLPKLNKGDPNDPILPDYDIYIGKLQVDRLTLGKAISGEQRIAALSARARVERGIADVTLNARTIDGADKLYLALVADPANKKFDIDADVTAPQGGVLASMAGINRSVDARITGQGNWDRWTGALIANADTAPLARLKLGADNGRYSAVGRVDPSLMTTGLIQRLSAGGMAVDIDGTFAARRFDGRASMVSRAIKLDGTGVIDLAQNRLGNVRIKSWVRDPSQLLNRMQAQNLQIDALLDGPMDSISFEYRATSPRIAFNDTVFNAAEAHGTGRYGAGLVRIPLSFRAASVTGVPPIFAPLLTNVRADGVLIYRDNILSSDALHIVTNRLDVRAAILANFTTGRYTIGFNGALPGFEVPGFGRVDLISRLNATPMAGGVGIAGDVTATVRRLDNVFLRTVAGGLPRVEANIALGPDGVLRLPMVRMFAPALTLTGSGYRRADGTFWIEARGRHRQYGPVTLTLDGEISRPKVVLKLDRPMDAASLGGVTLNLVPNGNGFAYTASGQSMLGPFTSNGAILLPQHGTAAIDIAQLTVSGSTARGRLAIVPGGIAGRLLVAGGGLDGTIDLAAPGQIQQAVVKLAARNVDFAGPPPISIARGNVDATLVLNPRGTSIDATFSGEGLRRGTLYLARFAGTAKLVDGVGQVAGTAAGARGRDFDLRYVANVGRDAYRVNAAGTIGGRSMRLLRPAVITPTAAGWQLAPAEMIFGGGKMRLSGVFGDRMHIDASAEDMPLSLLDMGWPDLGLGGRATGQLVYDERGGAPTGTAALRIKGLTRSGLSFAGTPMDVGLNAALSPTGAAMRAVVVTNGTVIGRLQGRVAPLGAQGSLTDRIMAAPLTAQLRYSGEASPLWVATGIEALSIGGPVAVAADVTGTLNNPLIQGAVRTDNGRIESLQTGTVLTGVKASGRFDGSRLAITSMTGRTKDGGTISGTALFELSKAQGFGMDINVQATNALLLDRDDMVARVTGPLRIQSDGTSGGVISGDVHVDRGSFRLGKATSAESLPVIQIAEINAPITRRAARASGVPWRMAIKARTDSRFIVTGLGLESEWGMNLDIGGTISALRINGDLALVRGEYMFGGRRFELEAGSIRFVGPAADPILDIKAVDDVAGIDATIRVTGTGSQPDIAFSSTPALPEDELLSRILFGSSITDISVAEAAQLGVALASLRGGGTGLDPINAIRRATGLDRLRILPADSTIGQGTAIAAGKYVTRRVYVEIITDGQGYSATRLEFQMTRWLSLLTSISTVGRKSANVRIYKDY